MAKYAISQEGIEALEMLKYRLRNSPEGISESCHVLYKSIELNEDGFGFIEKDILNHLKAVLQQYEKTRECIDYLINVDIQKKQLLILKAMALLGDFSGDDTDDSPQKVMTPKRR